MRRNTLLVLALFAVFSTSDAWHRLWCKAASEPAEPSPVPTKVALLDLARVFMNHAGFKSKTDLLRQEVETAEQELKRCKADLQVAANALEKLSKGSAEYRQLESKIVRDQAEINVKVTEQKRDFFEREAQMYLEAYQDIMAQVEKLAEPRGIGLVMRFNGDPIDLDDPQAIQKELNKAVLYHHKAIDITDDVIRIVNAKPAG